MAPRRVTDSISGLSRGFTDNGNLRYYYASPRCGAGKEKAATKKKLKLLKRLSKDLPVLSAALFGADPESALSGQVKDKMIAEASEVLLKRLEEMRAEEKRKKKEEKARRKGMRECELSSESSGSDCGEVVELRRVRGEAGMEMSVEKEEEEEGSGDGVSKRIEVCMGNKCRKSGGAALMEEFERVMGVEGAVVGCKCMGKCRDGPNVKVVEGGGGRNPLCIGVGLEDVGLIVANLLGEDSQRFCLSPAT